MSLLYVWPLFYFCMVEREGSLDSSSYLTNTLSYGRRSASSTITTWPIRHCTQVKKMIFLILNFLYYTIQENIFTFPLFDSPFGVLLPILVILFQSLCRTYLDIFYSNLSFNAILLRFFNISRVFLLRNCASCEFEWGHWTFFRYIQQFSIQKSGRIKFYCHTVTLISVTDIKKYNPKKKHVMR